jgi:hypothetical protein
MTDRIQKKMQKVLRTQPTTVNEWIYAKTKFPSIFQVNKDGDLISSGINEGESDKTIVLNPEVPATPDYVKAYFSKRLEDLKDPEEQYSSAKKHLHEVIAAYRNKQATIADVLGANQEVHDTECILNSIIKQPRYIVDLTNILNENDLSMNSYDKYAISEPVITSLYSEFPWKAFWMPPKVAEDIQQSSSVEETDQEAPIKRALSPEQSAARSMAIRKAKAAKAASFAQ